MRTSVSMNIIFSINSSYNIIEHNIICALSRGGNVQVLCSRSLQKAKKLLDPDFEL